MDLQAVVRDYQARQEAFLVKKGRRDGLLETRARLLADKEKKLADLALLEQVRLLLSESSRAAKERVRDQMERLVTSGLQYVFSDDLRFVIEITESRGQTVADFYVVSKVDGHEVKMDIADSRGGGVADVVSIILRFAMLQATGLEGPLLLDEPAKMVSEEYIRAVGEFLKQISETFGRQIIIATHNHYLAELADQTLRVSQPNKGASLVEVVS